MKYKFVVEIEIRKLIAFHSLATAPDNTAKEEYNSSLSFMIYRLDPTLNLLTLIHSQSEALVDTTFFNFSLYGQNSNV